MKPRRGTPIRRGNQLYQLAHAVAKKVYLPGLPSLPKEKMFAPTIEYLQKPMMI